MIIVGEMTRKQLHVEGRHEDRMKGRSAELGVTEAETVCQALNSFVAYSRISSRDSRAWAALTEYARVVNARVPDLVYGVYANGSALVGDFDLAKSDVDFVSVTQGAVSDRELKVLAAVHADLADAHPLLSRMDGYYIPMGAFQEGIAGGEGPHLCYRDAAFRGRERVPGLVLYQIKQDGARVWGPSLAVTLNYITWDHVVCDMEHNVNVYWANAQRRLVPFLSDEYVSFTVLTLCRILVTLKCGKIVSKRAAGEYAMKMLPTTWKPLVCEAIDLHSASGRISTGNTGRHVKLARRIRRARETRAFLAHMLRTLRDELNQGSS